MNEEAIFSAAIALPTATDRAAYLDRVCAGNANLRAQVEALLRAHDQPESFFEAPADTHTRLTEEPGTIIGRYKLLEQIGEGGFGVVFMAEQEEPVRRKVALKVIKPGMDTKEVIARFEAERQALAIMDHPNIARVLDAGATESGRPYFVMELVRGVPITEYCDQNNFPARDRLELFHSVCQAVQHAHQKGIIHRDIKPSNVLVTLHDDKPVPKVIDFGVAKATNARLTERTLFTRFAQMVGTPLYMSPEQAQMSGLDVDTRSDIYSLGVLLYELLTGTTPFDQQRIREAAYDELLRIIREEEPPRPSTRVSTFGEAATTSSAHRRTDPRRLSQTLRGELDWIVMKALEKDRARRYETASAFAADVQHYLNDEAVIACPPSAAYRFRKFACRNRSAMSVTAAALLVLIAVAIGSSIAAGRFRNLARRNAELFAAATEAEEQERLLRVEAQEQTQIAKQALADARQQRDRAADNFILARSAVDEFLNRVTEDELLADPGLHELRRELLESATGFYEEFIRDEANASELLVELAGAHYRIGLIRNQLDGYGAGMPSFQKSIELFEQLRDSGDDSLDVRLGLAKAYLGADRNLEGVALCEEILETNPQHPETRSLLGGAFNELAAWSPDGELRTFSETTLSDFQHGLTYYHKAVRIREELVRDFPDNPRYLADLGNTLGNLAMMLRIQGDAYDAIDLLQRAVNCTAQAYNRDPRWDAGLGTDLWNLALTQRTVGDHSAALESFERLVEFRRRLVFDNPRVPEHKAGLYQAWIGLANQQRHLNLADGAERSYQAAQEVLENMPRKEPYELFDLAVVYAALAMGVEQDQQQQLADQAVESLRAAIDDGYRDIRAIESYRALDILRNRDDFQQLVARVKQDAEALQREEELGDSRQSVELIRELIGNDPDAAQHQVALATALHSIAMVQMQIGQFDEAEQSLNEALELHRKRLRDGETDRFRRFDAIKTQLSLGQLYRMLERWPEAHTIWQECLAALAALADETRNDPEFQTQIGLLEITICDDYGALGLWNQASEHLLRNVQFNRESDQEIVWECRFASLLPGRVPDDQLQAYIERLERHVPGDLEPAWRLDPRQHLAWTAGCVAPDALPPDRFLTLMQPRVNTGITRFWGHFTLALAQHRAGQHAAALETLEKTDADWTTLDSASTLSATYLLALAADATGDTDRAEAQLQQAENLYRDYCRTLTLASAELAAPYGTLWWELPAAQALRREAWETIANTPAADPWQHLIQARGYRIVGEMEKSDAELAAAVAAAPDDPSVWLAHVELLEQWGEIERVDWQQADWERVIELAGDDPAAWTYRGRWHAEQGQFDEAATDFNRAADLIQSRDVHLDHPPRRPVFWAAMTWDGVYDRLVQLRPDDSDLTFERGLFLASSGKFTEALAAFEQGDARSGLFRRWAHLGMLLLLNDRREDYVRLCRDVESRYREQEWADKFLNLMSLVATVGPDSGIDRQTLEDWSARLWNNGDCRANASRAAGACSFRAGDLPAALEQLQRAHRMQAGTALADLDCFLLAMVHYQMGHQDESRQWYDRGVAALTHWRETPNPATQLIPYAWLQLNVQYREATALLGVPPDEAPLQIARETEPEPEDK